MSISSEERQEILQMLAAGKITVDEAAAMLAGSKRPEQVFEEPAVEEAVAEKKLEPAGDVDEYIKVEPDAGRQYKAVNGGSGPTWLHIRVSDTKTGKSKVTVNLPMRLVRFGLAIGRRYAPELEELDWNEISSFLGAEKGMLVEVEDEEDGEHVQIFVD